MSLGAAIRRLFGGPGLLPAYMQSEAAECGLACLAMILSWHGREVDLNAMRRRFGISIKGTTLFDIARMAEQFGMSARGVRIEPEGLRHLQVPAILHWDMRHFVVLAESSKRAVTVHDPAFGVRKYTMRELDRHFTGVALELTPTSEFERKVEIERLPLKSLWGRVAGLRRSLGQALILSLLLQLFVLAAPLYVQLAVDDAVARGDESLLLALAVGFGLLAGFQSAADWLRSRVLLVLGAVLNFQMTANLFRHLVRLPLDWFEKRHIGDIVSRFSSTRPIKELIADNLVATIVDGLMATLTLAMIFLYSASLAAIVLGALVASAALRLATFREVRRRQEEVIESTASEQTIFMETARAVQAVKLFGEERNREEYWQGRFVASVNSGQRLGRFQIDIKLANDLVFVLENILVVYFGARLVMDADLTVGMLFAFFAYKIQLVDKGSRLLETFIKFRMLDLHLERIADIALSERERGLDRTPLISRPVEGAIELRGISFRYADADPWVLSDVSFAVRSGEFVAITGPSGEGKTTLLKVMLGLLRPASGEILVDGHPLDQLGISAYRAAVGAVMQDDQLLTGSLAENVGFFDPALDRERLRRCAVTAGIDEEIMAMPMNYETLVGDLGTGLSGGQKQRILLARALYRIPRILFMDEGTSHLDVDRERTVNAALKKLDMTRIIIAHRPETVRAADRTLVLKHGTIESG